MTTRRDHPAHLSTFAKTPLRRLRSSLRAWACVRGVLFERPSFEKKGPSCTLHSRRESSRCPRRLCPFRPPREHLKGAGIGAGIGAVVLGPIGPWLTKPSVPCSEVRTSLQQDSTVRARVIIGAIVTAPGIDALVALVTGALEADACGLRGRRPCVPLKKLPEVTGCRERLTELCSCLLPAGGRLEFAAGLTGRIAMHGDAETSRVGVGHGMASGA